eukprot:2826687-Pleurochrysis_carterae.AAC.1
MHACTHARATAPARNTRSGRNARTPKRTNTCAHPALASIASARIWIGSHALKHGQASTLLTAAKYGQNTLWYQVFRQPVIGC